MRAAELAAAYPVIAVGRLANYIGRRLSEDPKLRRIGVRGEVSGLKPQPNGTLYFDLKDRDALIQCVAWSQVAALLPPLDNGQEVIAVGGVGTYGKKSVYQLTVMSVEAGGTGRLHAVYEELRRRLEAEGLFASARKRALPRYPFRIGLVSSRTANGAGDFLAQAATLAPHVAITLFETPVQGPAAAPEIVRAIGRASRAGVDLVVVARGGGSYEDLFVFSDERVVRALAACAHPTVSAIGHEADAPLVDFVADARAATPSTAAQTILPRRADLLRSIAACSAALDRNLGRTLVRARGQLERIERRSPLADPGRVLAVRRQAVDVARGDMETAVALRAHARGDALARLARRLEACNPSVQLAARRQRLALVNYALSRAILEPPARERRRLERLAERLGAVTRAALAVRSTRLRLIGAHLDGRDPRAILQRGYAIVRADGRAVRSVAEIDAGTLVTAELARGTLTARVEAKDEHGGR